MQRWWNNKVKRPRFRVKGSRHHLMRGLAGCKWSRPGIKEWIREKYNFRWSQQNLYWSHWSYTSGKWVYSQAHILDFSLKLSPTILQFLSTVQVKTVHSNNLWYSVEPVHTILWNSEKCFFNSKIKGKCRIYMHCRIKILIDAEWTDSPLRCATINPSAGLVQEENIPRRKVLMAQSSYSPSWAKQSSASQKGSVSSHD